MRILILTHQGNLTGSTNSIAFLCKGLADKGHQIYLGCRSESRLYRMLENTRVNLVPMNFKGKLDFQIMRQIKSIVNEYDIQVINAQSSLDRYSSILAKWRYKLPVKVVHTRRQRPRSIGGFLQNKFYIKGTDKIVVISDELKKQFIALGIPENHLHVIYNGTPKERYEKVDLSLLTQLQKQLGIKESDTIIGSISRIKNQDQIIKALPNLEENIKLLLVGVPVGHYDDLTSELNIQDRIIYAGLVEFDKVLLYYKLMRVNILASTMDGFGLVLTEAMAMSTPVIGTSFGGIKNVIIHEQNGLLFEDNDIPDLTRQIKRLLSDEELRNKLIANGKETELRKFSIDNTLDN